MHRLLFGPASPTFCSADLGTESIIFDLTGPHQIQLQDVNDWVEIVTRLPSSWRPECLVLDLAYKSLPDGLWQSPVPIIGLAPDWNLLWSSYQHLLHRCDAVLTDEQGVERMRGAGFDHVYPAMLFGLENSSCNSFDVKRASRDIDLLFIGNCHPAVQHNRLPWLHRLAKLQTRYKVVIRQGVYGEDYFDLLSRARAVFNRSIRSECNKRVAEAIASGAVLLQESDNHEVACRLVKGVEYVEYTVDDFEQVVDALLSDEPARQRISEVARKRLPELMYRHSWQKAWQQIEEHWSAIQSRSITRQQSSTALNLDAEMWIAATSGNGDRLRRCVAGTETSTSGRHASVLAGINGTLAMLLGTEPSIMADESPLTGLLRARHLCQNGQFSSAVSELQTTLACIEKHYNTGLLADLPHQIGVFDRFGVAWQQAGWMHTGEPVRMSDSRLCLLEARTRSLLAELTGNAEYADAASRLYEQFGTLAPWGELGCLLARIGRFDSACPLLQRAVAANPFDRVAARALAQTLTELGRWDERLELLRHQRLLHEVAGDLVSAEDWFTEVPLSGRERTSIIILACNEVELTRLCLASVVRHTQRDFELILVDNGSKDAVPDLFRQYENDFGPARVKVVTHSNNLGFAAGVNSGILAARGEFVVLLNNDTVVTPGWLDGLIAWSLRDWPQVGMVGPMTNYTAAPQQVEPIYRDLSGLDQFADDRRRLFSNQALDLGRLTGFCLLIRRSVLEEVGSRLDEQFGIGFFEDDDLCVRVRRAGYRLYAALDVYIHHFGSRTFASLGVDADRQLGENFQKFKLKWGGEVSSLYSLPSSQADRPQIAGITRPTVSLCLIVRNEERNLADCLGPVRDMVDEVIVVDTGSSDRTCTLAETLGAKVVRSSWSDSFSAARNISIEHARGDWIFWMDADDRIDRENVAALRSLFDQLDDRNRAFVMKCLCVTSTAGETATVVDHVRLFRNRPDVRWRYRVHEQILPALRGTGSEVVWSNVVIRHIGYTDPVLRKQKLERDLRLLRMEQGEQPNDPFTLFNLGAVLRELGQRNEALPFLVQSLSLSHPRDSIVRKLYSMVAQLQHELGSLEDGLQTSSRGRALFPNDAELLFIESIFLTEKGDNRRAETLLQQLIGGRDDEHFASVATGLRGYKARHNLAMICLGEKRWSEAEAQWRAGLLDEPNFLQAWVGIGESLLQRQQWQLLNSHVSEMRALGPAADAESDLLTTRSLLNRGDLQEAIAFVEKAIRRHPESRELQVLRSQLSAPVPAGGTNRDSQESVVGRGFGATEHVDQRVSIASSPVPRILVLCPDNPAPSGGVRRLYRHVDILRRAGMPSWLVHEKSGFRCDWFKNDTPVLALGEARVNAADYLVVPEIMAMRVVGQVPGIRTVIFNQNSYLTFQEWPVHGKSPYLHHDVVSTFAVSEDNAEYLRYAFPGLNVRRLHYGIDPHFAPSWPKRRCLAYMPRKNAADAVQVLNLLKARGALNGWEVVAMDGLSEEAVASRLSSTMVFLSFGHPEGCPLPPLEAMASGCVVIGYHGRGGREYFDPTFSYPIEMGDVIGMSQIAERVLDEGSKSAEALQERGRKASASVRERYSCEREASDIVEAWRDILLTRKAAT